jgi:hypothetical protein
MHRTRIVRRSSAACGGSRRGCWGWEEDELWTDRERKCGMMGAGTSWPAVHATARMDQRASSVGGRWPTGAGRRRGRPGAPNEARQRRQTGAAATDGRGRPVWAASHACEVSVARRSRCRWVADMTVRSVRPVGRAGWGKEDQRSTLPTLNGIEYSYRYVVASP